MTEPHLIQALVVGITTLATVVGTLYWQTRKHYDYIIDRLNKCEVRLSDCEKERTEMRLEIDYLKTLTT